MFVPQCLFPSLVICSKYDLYSKSKVRVDVKKVRPYYLSLIEKVSKKSWTLVYMTQQLRVGVGVMKGPGSTPVPTKNKKHLPIIFFS